MCTASTCSTSAILNLRAVEHRDRPSATCVGSLRPASHVTRFHASIARCRQYSLNVASVNLGSQVPRLASGLRWRVRAGRGSEIGVIGLNVNVAHEHPKNLK